MAKQHGIAVGCLVVTEEISVNSYHKYKYQFSAKITILAKKNDTMPGEERSEIKIGLKVGIVLKADQRSGKITEGVVSAILTSSHFHPHGIKVRLTSGEVGRVKEIK